MAHQHMLYPALLEHSVPQVGYCTKGVRQGDPFSPFLFNLAAECLTKMVLAAQKNNLFQGLASDLIDGGVGILQYADDTVLCISHDVEKAKNVKLLLYLFELMSGLKINFDKSEVFTIGGDNNIDQLYAEMFGCQVGKLPMKYLGVPVTYSSLKTVDWDFLDAKLIKRLAPWMGYAASSGARAILVNTSLDGIPSYFMSMFLLNKTVIEKMNVHRRRFFWRKERKKRAYHMIWSGGIGSDALGILEVWVLRISISKISVSL